MDIWGWIITTILILFGLFVVPYPYGKIGKKVKKGYTWSRGLSKIIYDTIFIKGSILESFVYFIEEFENFVIIAYTPSFPSMYKDLVGKTEFTEMEQKHINDENERVQASYFKIRNAQKLKRKGIFKQAMRDFKELVVDISKMARSIETIIKDKSIDPSTLKQGYIDRFKFSAREFNNFLRYFRSFLDKTYCYHEVEIEHNRLRQLLVPEELVYIEKVTRL